MTTPKRAMHCSNDISITSLRADSICMVSICTEGHSPSVAKLRGLTAYRCGSTEFIVAHTLFIVQYCFTRLSHLDITNSDLQSQRFICIMAYIYSLLRHGIYPYRHARAILMCLTLLNSFNRMKSFTMFIFSWLKFVKKRGTSIYLLRVYVMPSILCIHCTFLLWHNLGRHIFYEDSRIIGIDNIDKP